MNAAGLEIANTRGEPVAFDTVDDLERSVISALLLDSARIESVASIISEGDFADLKLRPVFRTILDLHRCGHDADLVSVTDDLANAGHLDFVGGPSALAEIFDCECTSANVVNHARRVRRRSLESKRRRLHFEAAGGHHADALRELSAIEDELAALNLGPSNVAKPKTSLETVAFRGDRILSLLKRPVPDPVLAATPVLGHFMLLIAASFIGKTSLVLWLAMRRAAGVAPWEGADIPDPGRVLLYSLDEAVEQTARRMRSLALFHPAGTLGAWLDRISILGPDREVDSSALELLRFTGDGLETLGTWLSEAEADGDPFREVYIDAYADVLPASESENGNEIATAIGGALERLAVQFGCAIVLLHHTGKPKADAGSDSGDLPDVRFLGRGASALAAKARVVASLERVAGQPHLRRVRTLTNLSRSPRPQLFQVCPPESDGEELLYFRPHDPLAAHDPTDFLGQEPITTNALAWALAKKVPEKGKRPPGEACRIAAQLREQWLRAGKIEVIPGPNRAKLMKLKEECAS